MQGQWYTLKSGYYSICVVFPIDTLIWINMWIYKQVNGAVYYLPSRHNTLSIWDWLTTWTTAESLYSAIPGSFITATNPWYTFSGIFTTDQFSTKHNLACAHNSHSLSIRYTVYICISYRCHCGDETKPRQREWERQAAEHGRIDGWCRRSSRIFSACRSTNWRPEGEKLALYHCS